ncbi:3442_t:CDS:2 [Racocetra persica]|uniref:3442_t:CDS:1 n=1 Tax=Racocetra persica TaxID=160502 RepID=A0ACA9L1P3_9GLOM|nr:3442_t:CDS:2 [Racocetra persica]
MAKTCRSLECAICCDKTDNILNMTTQCAHEPSTCQDCINKYVNIQLIRKNTLIKCLVDECDNTMEYQDVQRVVSRELFRKFDDVCLRLALQSDPGFRWCQGGSECVSGQIHIGGGKLIISEIDFLKRLTCQEYDIKIGKIDTESQIYLEKNTKSCPKCGIHIQKIDGCDHVKCKIESCLMEFCWLCLGDWQRGEHLRTCALYEGVEIVVSDSSEDENETYGDDDISTLDSEEEDTESSEELPRGYFDDTSEEEHAITTNETNSLDGLTSDSSDSSDEELTSDENDTSEESALSEKSISFEESTSPVHSISFEESTSENSTSFEESTSSEEDTCSVNYSTSEDSQNSSD